MTRLLVTSVSSTFPIPVILVDGVRDGLDAQNDDLTTISPDLLRSISTDLFLDFMAIQPEEGGRKDREIDAGHAGCQRTLCDFPRKLRCQPQQALRWCQARRDFDLNQILLGPARLSALVVMIANRTVKIDGSSQKLSEVLGCLEPFEFWFNIVTANPDTA